MLLHQAEARHVAEQQHQHEGVGRDQQRAARTRSLWRALDGLERGRAALGGVLLRLRAARSRAGTASRAAASERQSAERSDESNSCVFLQETELGGVELEQLHALPVALGPRPRPDQQRRPGQ